MEQTGFYLEQMKPKEFHAEQVERARQGDQSAVADLYMACYQPVFWLLKSMLHEREEAEEVLQECFLEAMRKLDQLGNDEKFPAWIKAIARNRALDRIKRADIIQFTSANVMNSDGELKEIQFEDEQLDHLPDPQLDQKETAQETTRLIREILDTLSDGQRVVVSLKYYQGQTVTEIARSLGRSEGTIKAQLYQARKKIQQKVLELEKNGTKLYGLMPVPFFTMLLRGMDSIPITPSAAGLTALLRQLGIGTAAAHTAAQTAAQAGAHSAAQTGAHSAAQTGAHSAAQTGAHSAAQAGAQSAAQAGAQTAAQTGAHSAAQTGAAAAKGIGVQTAAKSAAAAAGHAVKVKIAAGLLGAAIVGGSAVGGVTYFSNHPFDVPLPRFGQTEQQPDDSDAQTVPEQQQDADAAAATPAMQQAYREALLDLQDGGSFLQYAQMLDLNDDGKAELLVVYDTDQFALYEYDGKKASRAAENQFVECGLWSDEEGMCTDKRWREIERAEGDFATILLAWDKKTKRLWFDDYPTEGDGIGKAATLSFEDNEWKLHQYETTENPQPKDSEDSFLYWIDGQSVTKEAYEKAYGNQPTNGWGISDQLEELLDGTPVSQPVQFEDPDVRRAYYDYLTRYQEEKELLRLDAEETSPIPAFEFIYLDDDDVPELVLAGGDLFSSTVSLLEYRDGAVHEVNDSLGSNGQIYYEERSSRLFSAVNKDSGTAVLYELKNGALNILKTCDFVMDGAGELSYTIDGSPVSQEEGAAFWQWGEGEGRREAGYSSGNSHTLSYTEIENVLGEDA